MKILFVQLPLIDHSYAYLQGNVEYAPASLCAYLDRHYRQQVQTEPLPFPLSAFASDQVIARYLLRREPSMVAFTSYLWNIERNLAIARILRENRPDLPIVLGGPEITRGSWALQHKIPFVDYFVCGEGEWFFSRYLEGREMIRYGQYVNGNLLITQPERELMEADSIVEPFVNNRLNAMSDGSLFLELTRGCPYRCSYCYYSKNCSRVRELPFELLLEALDSADRRGLREIYILSPTFNRSRDFKGKLKILAERNHGVHLHTEMRTDGIDEKTARLIHEAGFRSVETGLQTLNPRALKRAGRNSDTERELRGMEELKKAGVKLNIGIIPGLPEDNPEDFRHTVDTLVNRGFADSVEYYPLMILPGTRIREEADREEVVYQKKPPYYYVMGWDFDYDSLKETARYVADQTEYIATFRRLPGFIHTPEGMLTAGIRFSGDDLGRWDGAAFRHLVETSVFDFHVRLTDPGVLQEGLRRLFRPFAEATELFHLILESEELLDESALINTLISLETDHLCRRLHIFDEWREGLNIQVYQVFTNPDRLFKAQKKYAVVDCLFRLTPENLRSFLKRFNKVDHVLVGSGMYTAARDALIRGFSYRSECTAFENEEEQELFYRDIGEEYLRLPFTFRMHQAG